VDELEGTAATDIPSIESGDNADPGGGICADCGIQDDESKAGARGAIGDLARDAKTEVTGKETRV
jgi:hypothetical protein